jgi:hypothetical protein
MLSAEQAKYTVYAAKVNRKTPRLRGRKQRFYFMRLADAERCKTVLCGLYPTLTFLIAVNPLVQALDLLYPLS